MQPIQFIVAAILGLAALVYVLYPLYRHPAAQGGTPETAGKLTDREQNARQALQEVEFDFQLGNLDEGEYRSLRTRYMNRALVEMKNRRQREQEMDEQIEEELRKLKEATSQEGESDGRV